MIRKHAQVSPIRIAGLSALVLFAAGLRASSGPEDQNWGNQDWTNYVRIGAYGLKTTNALEIVRRAQDDGVFGIEVDNDIPGRYESFVNPEEKLKAIRAVAQQAHAVGNKAFVYIAGTECITANGDKTPHTLAKEHPDWLQRKLNGEPALFGGGTAFWIAKGDEDVWVSPYAPAWRKIYMERVRQIAATGIDGIYVDIPYWMTHFDGWEDTWASFDDYTVAAFRKETGLDAKKDLKLGDFSDGNFRKWVDFRIKTITDFVQEIDSNAKAVNPSIKTIPEIYPGIEEESPRVGADVYSLYPVVGAIAHEYEFGSGGHMASERTPLNWFNYQVGMHSFRAFAQGKATWILNYSWDGDQKVDRSQAMLNLAASEIATGANFWDAPGHSMAGSNDPATRKKIFAWIKAHENTFYRPRTAIAPMGVYFSPETRNYYANEFISSYRGILILLMQKHLEFEVVTPRTLADFHGATLILPDVRVVSDDERALLTKYAQAGKKLLFTGDDAGELGVPQNLVQFSKFSGKDYYAALEKSVDQASVDHEQEFLDSLKSEKPVRVVASSMIATSISQVDGKPYVFFANFAGLQAGVNPVQTPQTDVQVTISGASHGHAFFLPFLGEVQPLTGTVGDAGISYKLPAIEKGAVFWYDNN
ncbi:MAG: hypothetical protein WB919_23965 [Candidatus Sulfotelmatobacter sp.]